MKLIQLLGKSIYDNRRKIRKKMLSSLSFLEAYSAAGGMGFGWWLVEHYLSYHVNCPDGCGLGESTRGRKDSPYFQMSYGSFDNIPDLIDPFVELPLPLQQGFTRSSLERCVTP